MSGAEAYRVPDEKEKKDKAVQSQFRAYPRSWNLVGRSNLTQSADGGTTNIRIPRGGRRTLSGQLNQGVQASPPW